MLYKPVHIRVCLPRFVCQTPAVQFLTSALILQVSAKSQLSSSLATRPQGISSSSAFDLGNGVRPAALPGGQAAGRATPNAKHRASQRSVHSTWELPAIRTVKLSGRQ